MTFIVHLAFEVMNTNVIGSLILIKTLASQSLKNTGSPWIDATLSKPIFLLLEILGSQRFSTITQLYLRLPDGQINAFNSNPFTYKIRL